MLFPPVERVSEAELQAGLGNLVRDGVYAQAVGALTTGVLLVGYGLALGASNLVIGLLAAVPFLAQLAQIPTILLVERLRARRTIAVAALALGRFLLVPLAFLPFLASRELAQVLLVGGIAASSALGAVGACSWNSWVRDLVPEGILGAFFARRLFYGTGFILVLGVVAGLFIDGWNRLSPGQPAQAYTALFLLGAGTGALSTLYLARVPEIRMAPPERVIRLGRMLAEPFRDPNFRRLIWFLGAWQFATNLAAPFFTVYLVSQLHYKMAFVMFLVVISQLANLLVLRKWGELTDRFSNKAVLRLCAPLFLLCIFAWTLVAVPEKHAYTGLLLILLHIAMGLTVAGVTLAAGNIGLKLAPRGRATAYLAAGSIVSSLAAGIAPVIGGLFADDFTARELSLILRWISGAEATEFVTLRLRHWDFFFLLASVLGLYALHRLTLVQEKGPGEDRAMLQEIIDDTRRAVASLSSVAGLRLMTTFPFGRIVQAARAKRAKPRPPGQPAPGLPGHNP
ncbi:MAG: major facilitator transporter [Rhodocyclaceae bacterium]|nr:major facilitator transporter [Rhodocyclaceae bacterium]